MSELILVGEIAGIHGVRGLLKVNSCSDNPTRFRPGAGLLALPRQAGALPAVSAAPRQLVIGQAVMHKGRYLLSFVGFADRQAAESLLYHDLYVERDELPPLPADRYYHFQLAGLKVYQDEAYLGIVREVLSLTANDILVVDKESGGELLIPALKAIVRAVDLDEGKMLVELPPGLAD